MADLTEKLNEEMKTEACKEEGGGSATSIPLPSTSPILTQPPKRDFYNLPTSSTSNLIMETLGAGTAIGDLPDRKKKISHGTKYEVTESKDNGKLRRVTMTTSKGEVTVEVTDIDKLTGSNKTAKKLFVFALIKANEHAIFNGRLSKNEVSFSLQELIDNGSYSSMRTARRGFENGMDILTSLKVKGTMQEGKEKTKSAEALEVLFTGTRRKDGQCTIFFNERINWGFIARYFTILPPYYFKLPLKSSELLLYIFSLARQNASKIEKQGFFNISFRAIHNRLQLPSENGNTRPQQTIKQPIEEAIAQIEEEHRKYYKNTELQLLPCYDEDANIKDYLDNGYLKVTLLGDFAKPFLKISQDTAKQIEEAEKKKARIMEKAVAINTAKALEAEKKNAEEAKPEDTKPEQE